MTHGRGPAFLPSPSRPDAGVPADSGPLPPERFAGDEPTLDLRRPTLDARPGNRPGRRLPAAPWSEP